MSAPDVLKGRLACVGPHGGYATGATFDLNGAHVML
jgi:hypothetical protein